MQNGRKQKRGSTSGVSEKSFSAIPCSYFWGHQQKTFLDHIVHTLWYEQLLMSGDQYHHWCIFSITETTGPRRILLKSTPDGRIE